VPTLDPTPLPSATPTPAPTTVLRGYKDCFSFSAQWVSDLKVYCPSIAHHFSEGCNKDMTKEQMRSFFGSCPALRSDFFTEGSERDSL
jgi:hypothetical protein